MRLWEEI